MNTIMIVKDPKKFPSEAKPSLILLGVDQWVNEEYIKMFLEEVPSVEGEKLSFISIRIFDWNKKKCVWVKMENFAQCEKISNFFNHPIKKNYPTKNAQGEKLDIFLAFDLLEITNSKWYGVILRNLPQNCSDESIKNYCENSVSKGVKYCINPEMIKETYCCIIVMNELEDAEELCVKLNGKALNQNRKIKVHFHPYICKIRKNEGNSKFEHMFNKKGYIFTDRIIESGNKADEAIALTKIYQRPKIENKENKKEDYNEPHFNSINKSNGINNNTNNSNNTNVSKKKNNAMNNNEKITSPNNKSNNSLLSLLIKKDKKDDNNQNYKSSSNNNNEQNNLKSNSTIQKHSQVQIIDDLSKILLNISSKKHIDTKEHVPSPKKTKVEPSLDTDLELGQIPSNINTKPHTGDCNDIEITSSETPKEMQIEYDDSKIQYYTYNMKDKSYYDNKKKEKIENQRHLASLEQFVANTKKMKQEIEDNIFIKIEKNYHNSNVKVSHHYNNKNFHYEHYSHNYKREYDSREHHSYHQRNKYSKHRRSHSHSRNNRRYSRSSRSRSHSRSNRHSSNFGYRNEHSKYSQYYNKSRK